METATSFVEDSLNGVLWNIVPVFLIAAGVAVVWGLISARRQEAVSRA